MADCNSAAYAFSVTLDWGRDRRNNLVCGGNPSRTNDGERLANPSTGCKVRGIVKIPWIRGSDAATIGAWVRARTMFGRSKRL